MTTTLDAPLVSTNWLAEHLQANDIRILDCSQIVQHHEDGSYGFVSGINVWHEGHIPNSIYVDISSELSDQNHQFTLMMPDPDTLADTFRQRGIGDNTTVVCYDRGNHAWAARVWWMLRTLGFNNAAVLDGGWKKWTAEERQLSTDAVVYPVAENFTLNYRPGLMADKSEVLAASKNKDSLLLHSLPMAVFEGKINPYQRPGRIPGSQNLYCEELLDPDTSCYLSREAMMEKLAPSGSLDAESVITYCGGGIAASSNALALTLVGQDNIAVYDGSLTEWTADPDMPLETG